ncbi:MAG TPA: energy transducer TonB [Pyrinomonadaceae bacterium]
MPKRMNLTLLPLVLLLSHAAVLAAAPRGGAALLQLRPTGAAPDATSERAQDGLAGPVRRVRTETAKIAVKNGKPVEGQRQVLETTTYDQKGNRVDNAYFLAAGGSLTGKEVYKYDERGNIVEMTLHNDDGSLLAKEVYTYEFDAVGNWVKMTTSVAMMEGGKVTFEPSEVTYRSISYFLDETMLAKMSQPAAAPAAVPNAAALNTAASNAAALNARPAAAAAQPQPAGAGAQQASAAQPRPSPAAADSAAKSAAAAPRNAAAQLLVASLDKGAVGAPAAPAPSALSNAAPAAGGPAVKSDAEAPAAPLRSGPLRPVSGGILNGKALSLPAPSYPAAAKAARVFGMVEVEVVIDINGKVISAKAVRGPALLLQAAEMAARLARFTPTTLSGQPMKVAGVITYNFSL